MKVERIGWRAIIDGEECGIDIDLDNESPISVVKDRVHLLGLSLIDKIESLQKAEEKDA